MTEIIVTGAAERFLIADRATLSVNMSLSDAERSSVVERAAQAHEHLVARATGLVDAGAASRYLANPVETYSNSWRDGDGRLISEHTANVSVQIELIDLELVGGLTQEFAGEGSDARVGWGLSDELRNSVLGELRAEAVEDARRAARDYASAIGRSEPELLSLRDGDSGAGMPGPLARGMMIAAEAKGMDVTIRDLGVRVQVIATFVAV